MESFSCEELVSPLGLKDNFLQFTDIIGQISIAEIMAHDSINDCKNKAF